MVPTGLRLYNILLATWNAVFAYSTHFSILMFRIATHSLVTFVVVVVAKSDVGQHTDTLVQQFILTEKYRLGSLVNELSNSSKNIIIAYIRDFGLDEFSSFLKYVTRGNFNIIVSVYYDIKVASTYF